jgi:GWxTD domain-containing protein
MNSFINLNQRVAFSGFDAGKPLVISYYTNPFPAAAPSFSTTQAKVSKVIKPDTTFTAELQPTFSFDKKGLYLVQQDTTSAEGVAFRVERDYPKLGTLETLAGPLVYICSKQEYEKITQAGNDKKKFDQVILSIVGNAERARTFMRGYFNRVEWANIYFSSYKEGWKTDRGMTFIVFGVPNEVYLFDDREVWEYKNDNSKLRFQFVKSPTVFDPDNYVLIRDKKFTDDWYKVVDLLRKARF